MRIPGYILTILLLLGFETINSQEVESEFVEIHLNNLSDTVPPSIKIISPVSRGDLHFQTDTSEFSLIGEVNDESAIKFVSLNYDLIPINELGVFSVRINLNPGKNLVKLVVSDIRDNLREEIVIVDYASPVETLAEKIKNKSNYFALIIGIDSYMDPNLPDLDHPINDAERLFHILTTKYTFSDNNLFLLKDAKRNDLVRALDIMKDRVTPDDNLLIFYAGHGNWDEKAKIGYWLPSDAYMSSSVNWFRNSTLVDYLKLIDSQHTLLITDACFAGTIFETTRSGFPNRDRAYEILYDLPSRKAMTSGTFTEVPDRSSFARYLIDRLNENEETYLSSEQLFSSFRIAVINNSEALPQYGVINNVGDEGGDFIFLLKE